MNYREHIMAILNYQPKGYMPVVSFGYWNETLEKWADEGHVTREEAIDYARYGDNHDGDNAVMKKLGFDFNWNSCFGGRVDLNPHFQEKIIEVKPDGSRVKIDGSGLIVLDKPGIVSISAEIGTSLTDRESWEELYLPKLQWSDDRINMAALERFKDDTDRQIPMGLHCGSLMGTMRNLLGVEELSYLWADDEDLFIEIAQTIAGLSHTFVKKALSSGAKFDYAHYWEDICFKNGPLLNPRTFDEVVGPLYKKNSELLNAHGIDIISVDCDGMIDLLIPTWLNNGVNTMFPIEVGTWDASIAPWREKYGKQIRGVGGMNKTVFSRDYAAVDAEIERLKPLIDLGGYIPCPDHRIAPDAIFENVQYYCEQLRKLTI